MLIIHEMMSVYENYLKIKSTKIDSALKNVQDRNVGSFPVLVRTTVNSLELDTILRLMATIYQLLYQILSENDIGYEVTEPRHSIDQSGFEIFPGKKPRE